MSVAIELVLQERKRQDEKWGADRNLDDSTWLTILSEEVGESAEAILKNLPSKTKEVVHVAAVALAWLECLLRDAEHRDGAEGGRVLQTVSCPACGSPRYVVKATVEACKNCGNDAY